MSEADFYPAGAYRDPSAPYNETTIPEEDFDVTCYQTLKKTVTVTTNDYIPEASGVDYETDDEGGCHAVGWQEDPDTSDTNWGNEYCANGYHTPLQLIELFKQCLEENKQYGMFFRSAKFTEQLIKECNGWDIEETEYVEE